MCLLLLLIFCMIRYGLTFKFIVVYGTLCVVFTFVVFYGKFWVGLNFYFVLWYDLGCSLHLIFPTILQNILGNLFMRLPERYALIASNSSDNFCLYYELISVALIGYSHVIMIILTWVSKPLINNFHFLI